MSSPSQMTQKDNESSTPLLEVDSVSVTFETAEKPIHALRNVSLTLQMGETLGVAGESGSGKSTLAAAIVNYLDSNGSIENGDIRLKGESVTDLSKDELQSIRGNKIALVPQDPNESLNPCIPVGEQIRETIEAHQNLSGETEHWEEVYQILERVKIPDPEHTSGQYPHQLSGGMQQRILLAIGLSCNPELLILDEPTTGLDVTTQANILELVDEIQGEFDMGTLLISHNLGVLAQVTDRVNIMYAGEFMEKGTTQEIFTAPAHPYTQGLLAATPEMGTEKEINPIPGQIPSLSQIPEGCIFADRCRLAEPECKTNSIQSESIGGTHTVHCRRWETARDNPRTSDSQRSSSENHGEVVIEGQNVKKYFDNKSSIFGLRNKKNALKAVDGVNLAIHESETVGLVGESGCGKSTLGRCLIDLYELTDGEVLFENQSLENSDISERFKSECRIVFQNPDSSLNPRKSIYETIERPLKLFTDLNDTDRTERVKSLLNQVELSEEILHKYPHELSGGQKQRVAIARAFATNPSFVVLDEPVASLDVSVQASILSLLDDLRDKYNTSYLLISHDLAVVNSICDRIAVMYLGEIIEKGSTDDIFNPPYHPYTEALLSSSPTLDPDQEDDRIQIKGEVPNARNPPSGCSFRTRCPKKIDGECCNTNPELEAADSEAHQIACLLDEEEMK